MKLYIMRHGDAKDGQDDAARPLSAQGVLEAERAGAFLSALAETPDVAYHSSLLRSRQTAEGVLSRLNASVRLEERAGLRPCDPPGEFASALQGEQRRNENILIVGHLPFVAAFASLLLSGSPDTISLKFTTGTLLALERGGTGQAWTLRFHMTAKSISRIVS